MSAKNMISVCERLCKGLPVRLPAMSGYEFAIFLYVLAKVRSEVR